MPNEILLEIFKHDLPAAITSYSDYENYIGTRKVCVKIYEAAIEAFWSHHIAFSSMTCGAQHGKMLRGRPTYDCWWNLVQHEGEGDARYLSHVRHTEIAIRLERNEVCQQFFEKIHLHLLALPSLCAIKIVITADRRSAGEQLRRGIVRLLGKIETAWGRNLQQVVLLKETPRKAQRSWVSCDWE